MDKLFEILALAREHGLHVEISLHNVPVPLALDMVQDGLLDAIERGAGGNPPTGRYEGKGKDDQRVSAIVFTDGPRRERTV